MSKLQSGLTQGTYSLHSAMFLSECILEAKSSKKHMFLATLGAQKAFDVVNHEILLRNLFIDSYPGNSNCTRELDKVGYYQQGTTS